MSNIKIPVSVDLGNSLQKLKNIETNLLKLLSVYDAQVQGLTKIKETVEDVGQANIGGNVADGIKEIGDAVDPLVSKIEAFKTSLTGFQGTQDVEALRSSFLELVQEAGGVDEALAKLGDLKGFDEFTEGLEDGLKLLEQYGEQAIDINFNPEPVKSVKEQLREANIELQNAVQQFGKLSPQAQAAAVKVAELKDVIEDAGNATKAADFDDQFQLFGKALQGVSAGFQVVTATQAIFGEQSKETEEALKKVQAVMALTQGIQGLIEGKKAFEALGASAGKALKGIKAGIAATGIGVLLIAVGTLVAYWDDIKEAISGVSEAQRQLVEDQNRSVEAAVKSREALEGSEEILKRQGKSEKEILRLKALATLEEVNKRKESIAGAAELRQKQVEATARNAKVLEGFLNLVTLPQKILYDNFRLIANKVIDLVNTAGKAFGFKIDIDLPEKPFEAINKKLTETLFDPVAEKKAADEAAEADKEAIAKLENQYAGYLNKIDDLDRQAAKASAQRAKDLQKEKEQLQKAANQVLFELKKKGVSEEQAKIFEIEKKFLEDRKTLEAAGITDFSDLERRKNEDILKVIDSFRKKRLDNVLKQITDELKARAEAADKQKQLVVESRNLAFRAELAGIKDENQRRSAELRKNENDEQAALEEKYAKGLISLDKFLADQKAIEDYYANVRKTDKEKQEEEELKKIEAFQSKVADAIADAASALGEALVSGADPFAAVFKSIANSLGSYLQQLGKEAILTSKLILKLRALIGTPQGIVTGVALVALGAVIKAAFSKKAEKGFATGGYVEGPGTETSDSIPARLSKGEFVIKAKSVKKYGRDTLEKLNEGKVERFKTNKIESVFTGNENNTRERFNKFIENNSVLELAIGGKITGPGTSTSDSVPALLSNGEYVVSAKSVNKYGIRFFEKLNQGLLLPDALTLQARQPDQDFVDTITNKTRNAGTSKALVNRSESITNLERFAEGGYVYYSDTSKDESFLELFINRGRKGGSAKVLVNRSGDIQLFNKGGYVMPISTMQESAQRFANGGQVFGSFATTTRNGGTSKALVNRIDVPEIPNVTMTETMQREVPYIATTKVSGQDLKIILERADKRFSNVT